MLSLSFQLTAQDLLRTFRKSDLIARSLLVNFLVIPLVALLLTRGLALPKTTTVTLLLASAAPGAPFAPKLAAIAGGDLASAIGLTFILSILAVVITPLMVRLTYSGGEDALINILPIVWSLVLFQLVPLLVGLAIRHQSALLAKRLLHPVRMISDILFVALIVMVVSKNFEVLFSVGWLSLAAMVLFIVVTLVSGWGIGGFETRTRKALTLTTASRNLALVLLIAVESFPRTDIEAAVIAFGLVELALTLLVAVYFRWSCQVE
jgi:bile acid:Na+ symporter, BASS family